MQDCFVREDLLSMLKNHMKMHIGKANSSCIDNEMLLKAIHPDNDQYNARTQDRLAVKEAGRRKDVKRGPSFVVTRA